MQQINTLEAARLKHVALVGATMFVALILIGAGCAGAATPADKTEGSNKKGGSEATITFGNGVTIDCAESGWTCSSQYGGDVTFTGGTGVLTVTETFSTEAAKAASEQKKALATQGNGVITEEATQGDMVTVTVDSEGNNRTNLHVFKVVDGKAYRCTGTVERAAFDVEADNILDMCSSMRK
jgi:hypothetical protein